MSDAHARAFLLDALGLRGALWPPGHAPEAARQLGMIQIDSINVTGLRNHEIAWAARTDAPIGDLYKCLYRKRAMLETHFPLFATRRDWVPWFLEDFGKGISNRDTLRTLRPVMRRVIKHINDHGPTSPADFEAARIPGGFNTVKATTKALEYLFLEGKLQIAGRTAHFHRLFDLTERVAPELLTPAPGWRQDWRRGHGLFFVRSALDVLKLATPRQLAERTAHHLGSWRVGGIAKASALVAKAEAEGLIAPVIVDHDGTAQQYYVLRESLADWHKRFAPPDEAVRIIPPLDNLLFSRRRLAELFDFTYKFEAYTPRHARRFYYAMPILYHDRVTGLIDAKRDGKRWVVAGLQIDGSLPIDPLRAAVHRIAAIAGADMVAVSDQLPQKIRKALAGRLA